MVRPEHVCCGLVLRQPQSTVLMAYQPGGSGAPAFSPTVSPGCVTDPARAGTAVQSDRTPAAANFVNLLFICNSPIAPQAAECADRSAEPHLVYAPRCFCPMVTTSRQLLAPSFLGTVAEMLFAHSTAHGIGPSRKFSNFPTLRPMMVLQFLLERLAMWPRGHTSNPAMAGHYRRGGFKTSSFVVGTARRGTLEDGMKRLICDPPSN